MTSGGLFDDRTSHATDLAQLLLQAHFVEAADRKRYEDANSLREHPVGIFEGKTDLCFGSVCIGGIRNAPMCGHRLTRPYRADFTRGVIANREHEIERRRARPGKLRPRFGAKM